jgi:integrase
LQQARAALAGELQRVEKTRLYGIAPAGPETFAAVLTRYLAHQKPRLTPAGYERTRGITHQLLQPFFGTAKLSEIRRVDIQRYVTHRSALIAAGTVARELNVLKRLFSLCVEWELLTVNASSGVRPPRVPSGRVRYLQPAELRNLLEKCPDWLKPIVGLAVTTGMRRGEILCLRWVDLDRQGERVCLPQTKNGESRIVYLNAMASQVIDFLAGTQRPRSERIFAGIRGERVSVACRRAARAAAIEDFRFHDLRHTAASWLRMSGADIHTVAQLLGHKDLRMAARYQHLSPAFLADAVKRLDSVFADPMRLLTDDAKVRSATSP